MDFGDTIMAAGLVRAERNQANASIEYANKVIAHEAWRADENAKVVDKYIEILAETEARAKAHIHALRTRNKARQEVEASMSEVIAKYEPDNPLTSPEHVEALVDVLQAERFEDPEIVKRTYPDGKIVGKDKYLSVGPGEPDGHKALWVRNTIA